jgi:hypothetical protein
VQYIPNGDVHESYKLKNWNDFTNKIKALA